MAAEMVVITDLITLEQFIKHAIRTLGGIDVMEVLSVGNDGINEMANLFEKTVKPGDMVCTFQVAETPLADNGSGASTATFACTIMILEKTSGGAQLPAVKTASRNKTWKKMLRLVGLIQLASEWYANNVKEVEGEDYEVIFQIFQERLMPVGKIANANVQGWLLDLDITIPVNGLMYE